MNKDKLDQKIIEYKAELVGTVQSLIQINSVEKESVPGKPFGPGVNEALEYVLDRGAKMGLKTKNVDGYAGFVELGSGSEMVGVLCHLDVVPAGEDWSFDPFGGKIAEDRIYGRGSVDDKGPSGAMLYVLKAIKELDINLGKRLRIIYGTDEESGWGGINYYLEQEETPDLAFSPDAKFPVIHAEKGILIFDLSKEFSSGEDVSGNGIRVKKIEGGQAPNMVPDFCQALLVTDNSALIKQKIKESDFDLELEEKNKREILLKSHGKSAHGSTPEQGINAISQLMIFLNSLNLVENSVRKFIEFYEEKIGFNLHGENINCYCQDQESGELIFNSGMIKLDVNRVSLTVNIRYPVTFSGTDIITQIKEEIDPFEIDIDIDLHYPPLHFPKNNPLVQTLNSVYNNVTGENKEPIAIGGGTYARSMDNAVAFGPVFPGKRELAHKKDEYIEINDLLTAAQIYARALVELGQK
ncbi:MAG: dipeptidase PepV [Bacillota bacterium]